ATKPPVSRLALFMKPPSQEQPVLVSLSWPSGFVSRVCLIAVGGRPLYVRAIIASNKWRSNRSDGSGWIVGLTGGYLNRNPIGNRVSWGYIALIPRACQGLPIFSPGPQWNVQNCAHLIGDTDFSTGSTNRIRRRSTRLAKNRRLRSLLKPLLHEFLNRKRTFRWIPFHHFLHIFRDQIGLQVDRISCPQRLEVGHLHRVRDNCHGAVPTFELGNRQADAFNRNRPLEDGFLFHFSRQCDFEPPILRVGDAIESYELADTVNVTLHNVTAETAVRLHGELEIDQHAFANVRKRSTHPCLGREVGSKGSRLDIDCRETDSADSHAVPG